MPRRGPRARPAPGTAGRWDGGRTCRGRAVRGAGHGACCPRGPPRNPHYLSQARPAVTLPSVQPSRCVVCSRGTFQREEHTRSHCGGHSGEMPAWGPWQSSCRCPQGWDGWGWGASGQLPPHKQKCGDRCEGTVLVIPRALDTLRPLSPLPQGSPSHPQTPSVGSSTLLPAAHPGLSRGILTGVPTLLWGLGPPSLFAGVHPHSFPRPLP